MSDTFLDGVTKTANLATYAEREKAREEIDHMKRSSMAEEMAAGTREGKEALARWNELHRVAYDGRADADAALKAQQLHSHPEFQKRLTNHSRPDVRAKAVEEYRAAYQAAYPAPGSDVDPAKREDALAALAAIENRPDLPFAKALHDKFHPEHQAAVDYLMEIREAAYGSDAPADDCENYSGPPLVSHVG